VEVANVANVPRDVTARVEILAPSGAISWTQNFPLKLLAGTPRIYALGPADSSGWAAGVYTVNVALLDSGDLLVPDGAGFGSFAVGQALVASQAVLPEVVSPGTISVTTLITTEIVAETIQPVGAAAAGLFWEQDRVNLRAAGRLEETLSEPEQEAAVEVQRSERGKSDFPPAANAMLASGVIRHEQDGAALVYSGTWSGDFGDSRTSGGSYRQSATAGATASVAFTGTWVNLGVLGGNFGGLAEIVIDGASQGIIDTYRRDTAAISFVFDGLIDASHVLTMTVLDDRNPNSSNDLIRLDYVDEWDGTPLPDGLFEQDDPRLFLSTGWSTVAQAVASGGSFIRGANATAWFPFSGPSFTLQTLADGSGGRSQLYVDGRYLDTVNNFSFTPITHTYSYTGFVDGLHILQIAGYDGNASIDVLGTPGSAPFEDPTAPPSGFTRVEEDDVAFLYNGLPFTQTTQSWSRLSILQADRASQGQYIASSKAGDEVSFGFEGQWFGLGFLGRNASGGAEIYLDGALLDTLDLYRNEEMAISRYYDGLAAGSHAITVTVVGDGEVAMDFVDLWDGTPLADGSFDQNGDRILLSAGWSRVVNGSAGGGDYLRSNKSTVWFPFTGDTVTFQPFKNGGSGKVRLEIDGRHIGQFDLGNPTAQVENISFDGLGAGAHVMTVYSYRSNADVDAFVTPGIAPYEQPPPPPSGFTRYEEDDLALLYNGVPFTQTASTWSRENLLTARASDGQYMRSQAMSNTVSLSFTGQWLGIGFAADRWSGRAAIFIDGVNQEVVDLYRTDVANLAFYYDGLGAGPHQVEVVLLGPDDRHPNALLGRVQIDYFDVWDGTGLPDGLFEEDDPRLLYSAAWSDESHANASQGDYRQDGTTGEAAVWFPFTGDSVSYRALALIYGDRVRASIDGEEKAILNLYAGVPTSRTFSFDGLGPGIHVLQLERYRGEITIDTVATPGNAPFYETPNYSGVVRHEEDDPALRYNGEPFVTRPTSWGLNNNLSLPSGGWRSLSGALSNTVSLTFDGSWVGLGFVAHPNTGKAEILIDGASVSVVDTYTTTGQPLEVYFGHLVTGTHTVTVRVLDERNPSSTGDTIYLDYIDAWDGTAMPDGWVDAIYREDNGRIFFSHGLANVPAEVSEGGSYAAGSFSFSDTQAWFLFTGQAFTFLGRSVETAGNNAQAELFIDGLSQGILDMDPEFSEQPVAFHFGGLEDGPHTVRIASLDNGRYDAFEANPEAFLGYVPNIEWYDTAPGDLSGIFRDRGLLSTIAAGDLEGDGVVELVAPSSNGSLYVYRGDGQDAGGGTPLLWT